MQEYIISPDPLWRNSVLKVSNVHIFWCISQLKKSISRYDDIKIIKFYFFHCQGLNSTYKYCDKHKIPYKKCGKLVVATNDLEVERLHALFERAQKNGVPDIELIKGEEAIKKYEPYCNGLEALWSPHTGIVDWAEVAKMYGIQFEKLGGKIHLNFEATKFVESRNPDKPIQIVGKQSGQSIDCGHVLTCAGLQSDRVAVLTGCSTEPKIVPFRGEYLLLSPEKAKLINGNIYPVPDPAFPFLGVHFTPRMNGEVRVHT